MWNFTILKQWNALSVQLDLQKNTINEIHRVSENCKLIFVHVFDSNIFRKRQIKCDLCDYFVKTHVKCFQWNSGWLTDDFFPLFPICFHWYSLICVGLIFVVTITRFMFFIHKFKCIFLFLFRLHGSFFCSLASKFAGAQFHHRNDCTEVHFSERKKKMFPYHCTMWKRIKLSIYIFDIISFINRHVLYISTISQITLHFF